MEDKTINEMNGTEGRVPYQFYVEKATKDRAMQMVGDTGLDLSYFMRMAMEEFIARPIGKSILLLQKHNKQREKKVNVRSR